MANEKDYSDPDILNPAKRAELGVSAAASDLLDLQDVEDVVIVDEKLRAQEEERLTRAREAEADALNVTKVTEERAAAPVLEVTSERNAARLLVITRDPAVFAAGSSAFYHIGELSNMFAEVHVILLNEAKRGRIESQRIGNSVWLYATNSMWWSMTTHDAKRIARKQLMFGNGFRPDIIVAKDSFEAGFAAAALAKKYNRPYQIHVADDFFDPFFKDADTRNNWRLIMADSVLKHAPSVRTPSEYLKGRLEEKYRNLKGSVELLPVFYNLDAWKEAPPLFDARERYPQFKFLLLHISNMNRLSHTDVAIDGVFYILRQYPTIGLIIVGEGPELEKLQKTVHEYGLDNQVIFESPVIDVLSLMKSAQLLIHTSEESQQQEIVLKAAAVGLPIVGGSRGVVSEIFIDEESVLLCPVDSPPCFGEKVNRILNDNRLRQTLTMNARDTVFDSVEQDYDTYIRLYRMNIEQCSVVAS